MIVNGQHEARKVLFVPHFNHTFRDMLPVALRLREQRGFTSMFLIRWPNSETSVAACKEYGIPYILMDAAIHEASAQEEQRKRPSPEAGASTSRAIIRLAKKVPLLSDVIELLNQFRSQTVAQRNAQRLMAQLEPDCLVIFDDRDPNSGLYLIQAANRMGIPSLLFPHESVDSPAIFAEKRLTRGWTVRRLSLIQWLIYIFLKPRIPNLSMRWKNERVLWSLPGKALVSYLKGVSPRQPWVRGGSDVAWFAVQSLAYRDELVKAGVEPRKLVVTGYPPHDRPHALAQSLPEARRELCERFGIPREYTIVCFADQITKQYRLYTPLEPVINDVLFAVQCILNAAPYAHVIYKLHPRNEWDDMPAPLSGHPRLSMVRDVNIQEVTAGSDLFVTQFSNTVYGALALGKPIIAFDFQNLGIYDVMMGHLAGIHQARSRAQFRDLAQRLLDEPGELTERTGTALPRASSYAMCDGMATQRLVDVIHYLIERPSGDPNEVIVSVPSSEQSYLRH